MDLVTTSVEHLKSIGPKGVITLNRLGIKTVFDMLVHLPYSYDDRTEITRIAQLEPNEFYSIRGTIQRSRSYPNGNLELYIIYLEDDTGVIKATFFNLKDFQKRQLSDGDIITLYGKTTLFNGNIQLTSPEICHLESQTTYLTPSYHLTKSLKMITMRKYASLAIEALNKFPIQELIPKNLLPDFVNMSLTDALNFVHCPPPNTKISLLQEYKHPAQTRIFLDELIAHQLGLIQFRKQIKQNKAHKIPKVKNLINKFTSTLPFQLTKAQISAFEEISEDLTKSTPMNRLVQGDVGSGKTLVAILAALQAVANNSQVAVMVPTEILAKQHTKSFQSLLSKLGFRVECLVSKIKSKEKKEIIQKLASGEIDIIIGTHAIFQKDIVYKNLNLLIIDEQHRFGVKQRLQLKEKGQANNYHPHMLSMSATPIPRTLAQTLYSDLDISIINELPPGRTPITTFLLSTKSKQKLIERIAAHCKLGFQVYWVCCLIEESENLECQDAENALEYIRTNLPEFNAQLIHGKLKQNEKQEIMEKFSNGEINILVATSVIEVGINVPNAFLIVIENAERHGLAQLHQLRGRVGRGTVESYCCLLCHDNISEQSKQRLQILTESNDGFYLAQKDLEFRGPGDILGTDQTGAMKFKVANLVTDGEIVSKANYIAKEIYDKYPELITKIVGRWYPNGDKVSDI
jgi:ATP-dependent DNA helicase RecG